MPSRLQCQDSDMATRESQATSTPPRIKVVNKPNMTRASRFLTSSGAKRRRQKMKFHGRQKAAWSRLVRTGQLDHQQIGR